MARVLVLSFKNNEAAEQVVFSLDRIQGQDYIAGAEFSELGLVLATDANPEVLVARPTVSCKHPGKQGPWKKTDVFGWYVHDVEGCRRPARAVVANFIKNMVIASGNNLLPALRKTWQPNEEEEQHVDPPEVATTETTETTETENKEET
jgi:hypothetical protein